MAPDSVEQKIEKIEKVDGRRKNGGHPKSGRKPGGQNKRTKEKLVRIEDARAYLEAEIRKHLPDILLGQVELAKGIHVGSKNLEIDPETGEIIKGYVYRKDPDPRAAKFLVDQLIGKAKQSVEVNGQLRTIVDIINDLEKGDEG